MSIDTTNGQLGFVCTLFAADMELVKSWLVRQLHMGDKAAVTFRL